MRTKRKELVTAGLAVLGLSITACGGEEHPQPVAEEAAPVAVETVAAEAVQWPSYYEAIGTVRARTAATIQSKVMGYVQEVRVDTGDRVRQGDGFSSSERTSRPRERNYAISSSC